ncbi:SPFH domain-containing protein [Acetobacter sp. DsW_063]|uniref:SPFH domain-containing protein n=1 Tax=Acetobacter sp. DsW_063 TaxID=1514894 RepID=UPI000A367A5C|nr:SPFH domain-containing protein [Acetobacter sp. DsW_063]
MSGHASHAADASRSAPSGATLGRFALAGAVFGGALLAATSLTVSSGQAVVVTRFGAPVRVQTSPGLTWKMPAPLEMAQTVDMQTRTTSGGLQDVGTRDGLRVLVQAFIAWSIPNDPDQIKHFLRATGNDPDEAARQLRSLLGSTLQIVASDFALSDLINTVPSAVKTGEFEKKLLAVIRPQAEAIYGVRIEQVGVERLSLPAETLSATVARMRAERETVAAARTAEGLRKAAAIKADAERDARIIVARAKAEAAITEAKAHAQAAAIYAESYGKAPDLYAALRTLGTINEIAGRNTRLVMRTDAAPFNVLTGLPGAGRTVLDALPSPVVPQDAIRAATEKR